MFKKILVANRGEIACRIIKTAKKLNIYVIAIYSRADYKALHVQLADEAHCVGEAKSQESYLNKKRIIEIAKKTGAEAIHPGYGFLAENAEFSEMCQSGNIVFIGPSPASIIAMGDKTIAKKTMEKAGIPVTPGYWGEKTDAKELLSIAKKIGTPLLIKAAAGGGGKGMRLVENIDEFKNQLHGAKREARASFDDERIFLEKLIKNARHVELQIAADFHQNVVYLFDRDCSVQRRHQKIIEEAKAPGLSDTLRRKMAESAIKAAKTINYFGVGTIEFLVDSDENYYFMEMNTRLQVEHPVTEMITGIDLVEWQFRIAAGENLPLKQPQIKASGHAIEARICAENVYANFQPSIGKITHFILPEENNHVRIDSGFKEGDEVNPFYDSLLAKLIVHAKDRNTALKLLHEKLQQVIIIGVKTNIELLIKILETKDFQKENITTNFIQIHQSTLLQKSSVDESLIAITALYYFLMIKKKTTTSAHLSEDPYSPWYLRDNWRLSENVPIDLTLWSNDKKFSIKILQKNSFYHVNINANQYLGTAPKFEKNKFIITMNDKKTITTIFLDEKYFHIFFQGEHHILSLESTQLREKQSESEIQFISPMPGTIVEIYVDSNQKVKKGDKLIVIEAMKMEHTLLAPNDGTIKKVYFKSGDFIHEGVKLLEFET